MFSGQQFNYVLGKNTVIHMVLTFVCQYHNLAFDWHCGHFMVCIIYSHGPHGTATVKDVSSKLIPNSNITTPLLSKYISVSGGCFQMHFRDWKILYFDSNVTEVCSQGSNWQQVRSGSGNGLGQTGDNPLPEPLLTQITEAYMRD